MKEILQTLHSVRGVKSACLCNLEGKLLVNTFASEFDEKVLERICYTLTLGIRTIKPPRAIYGTYSQGRVVIHPFEKGLIIISGERDIKQLLLKTVLDKAIKDILSAWEEASGVEKQLTVVEEKIRENQAQLDPKLIEEWELSGKEKTSVREVELQAPDGKIARFRIKTRKGLTDKIELNAKAIAQLGIHEGDSLTARPVIEITSEVEDFFGKKT